VKNECKYIDGKEVEKSVCNDKKKCELDSKKENCVKVKNTKSTKSSTGRPTPQPTPSPVAPTNTPTDAPSAKPSTSPTESPSGQPSTSPSESPSNAPTTAPVLAFTVVNVAVLPGTNTEDLEREILAEVVRTVDGERRKLEATNEEGDRKFRWTSKVQLNVLKFSLILFQHQRASSVIVLTLKLY